MENSKTQQFRSFKLAHCSEQRDQTSHCPSPSPLGCESPFCPAQPLMLPAHRSRRSILSYQTSYQRKRHHIRTTFIIVYCYDYSALLLVIVVNLLQYLIYKLNFIILMCTGKIKCICIAFGTICGFRNPRGSWNVSAADKETVLV